MIAAIIIFSMIVLILIRAWDLSGDDDDMMENDE